MFNAKSKQTFNWGTIKQLGIFTFYHNGSEYLSLCVADNLTQVVACHGEGVAVTVAEPGTANLRVCHTLVVQMCNLKRGSERKSATIRTVAHSSREGNK